MATNNAFFVFVFIAASIFILATADGIYKNNEKYDGAAKSFKDLFLEYYQKQKEKNYIQNFMEKISKYQNTGRTIQRKDTGNPMLEKKDAIEWLSERFGRVLNDLYTSESLKKKTMQREDTGNPMFEKKDASNPMFEKKDAIEQWMGGRFGRVIYDLLLSEVSKEKTMQRENTGNPMFEKKDALNPMFEKKDAIEQWMSGRFGRVVYDSLLSEVSKDLQRRDEVNSMIEKKDSEIESRFNREAVEQWLSGRFARAVYELLLSKRRKR